jgi:hypothetical protein
LYHPDREETEDGRDSRQRRNEQEGEGAMTCISQPGGALGLSGIDHDIGDQVSEDHA